MKLTKATSYALHTLMFMASNYKNIAVSVSELADKQNIAAPYLSKVLTKLTKAGLIFAESGANGGYSLISSWEKISFLDVIVAIEGKQEMFIDYFHDDSGCPIRIAMAHTEEVLKNQFASQTLKSLIPASGHSK